MYWYTKDIELIEMHSVALITPSTALVLNQQQSSLVNEKRA